MVEKNTTLDDFTNSNQTTGNSTHDDGADSETDGTESGSVTCPCWSAENDEEWQNLLNEKIHYDPGCGHAIDYLRQKIGAKIKESTAKSYASRLRYFIEDLNEHGIILENVTLEDVDMFMNRLARSGRSESTLSLYRTVITEVVKHIELYRDVEPEIRWDHIREGINPSDYQTPPELEREPLEEQEAKRLFDELNIFRNRLLVQAGIELGSRSQDLRTIEMDDVDLGKQEIVLKNTKSGGQYTLPLSEDLALQLKHWMSVERPSLSYAEDDGYLFPSRDGGALSGERLNMIIKEAADRAGIQEVVGTMVLTERQQEFLNISKSERRFYRVTAHTLRHTFSYLLEKEGYDLNDLRVALDHESTETTESSYSHEESNVKEGMPDVFSSLEM